MSDKKMLLFVCEKYPELTLVFKRDRVMNIDGEVVREPAEYIGFVRGAFGGQYETDDEDKIAFLREHRRFKVGEIIEVGDPAKLKAKKQPEKVVTGGMSTGAREEHPETPEPEDREPEAPAAAKVPSKLKKKVAA